MAHTHAAPAAATSAPSTDPIFLHARAMNTLVRIQRELLKLRPDYEKLRQDLKTANEAILALAAVDIQAAQVAEAEGDGDRIAFLADCAAMRAVLMRDLMNLCAQRGIELAAQGEQVTAKTTAPTAH